MLEINKVHEGDCRLLIPQCGDNYPKGVITDFPYGIDFQSNHRKKSEKFRKIQNDKKPFIDAWIQESYRILPAKGGFLFTFYRWDVQDVLFDELEASGFKIKSQCLWIKSSPGLGDLEGSYGECHECMVLAVKGNWKFPPHAGRPKNIYRSNGGADNSANLVHPNEKPIWLMQQIVRDLTSPGDLVIEPFSGSGTTLAACISEKRRCIAIEKDGEIVPQIKMSYIEYGNKRAQFAFQNSNKLF